ncbi:MAG: glutathione S-transferase N-terminal domain-containing protein [Pseudomonadota bacterium]
MIDLYTWATPNGRKVSIALEEMQLPYEVQSIDIGKDQQFDPAFLAISPNNKIPAIHDRDTGTSLMESGAILLWLAEKRGKFLPDGTRWEAMEWLMWQMAGFGPMLGQAHHFLKFKKGTSEYAELRYGAEARRLYGVLDVRLKDRGYIAGSYSIVDMATWPWVSRFEWQQIDLSEFPNVRDWYLRIADRAAVQRGYDVPHVTTPIPMP